MTANPRWPWPGEDDLARARRVANAYREHLARANPQVCAALDDTMRAYGELWAIPVDMVYERDRAITTAEAAELVGVTPELIRHWARLPHPDDPDRTLLPRFRRRGRDMTYLVMHVEAAVEAYRRLQHASAGGLSTRSA